MQWESEMNLILQDMKIQSGVNHAFQYNVLALKKSWLLEKYEEALSFAQASRRRCVHRCCTLDCEAVACKRIPRPDITPSILASNPLRPQLVAEHHPGDPAVWVDVAELYHLAGSFPAGPPPAEAVGAGKEAPAAADPQRRLRFGILGRCSSPRRRPTPATPPRCATRRRRARPARPKASVSATPSVLCARRPPPAWQPDPPLPSFP